MTGREGQAEVAGSSAILTSLAAAAEEAAILDLDLSTVVCPCRVNSFSFSHEYDCGLNIA